MLSFTGNRIDTQFNSTHTQVYNGEFSGSMKLPKKGSGHKLNKIWGWY